jgi:NADH-quinone oxidoreductase subunit L
MTGPLVVLGVLTVAGGLLNVPPLLGGHAWLHHWLEPVTATGAALSPAAHLPHAVEWVLLGLAVAIAMAGIKADRWLLPKAAKTTIIGG